mmetsp:Transcript_22076/g.47586  ORF Transcript_22076/g.47586 Transcript_22076/m.47586 type:complete len:223 (+) Transcript_22076:181-849(+)
MVQIRDASVLWSGRHTLARGCIRSQSSWPLTYIWPTRVATHARRNHSMCWAHGSNAWTGRAEHYWFKSTASNPRALLKQAGEKAKLLSVERDRIAYRTFRPLFLEDGEEHHAHLGRLELHEDAVVLVANRPISLALALPDAWVGYRALAHDHDGGLCRATSSLLPQKLGAIDERLRRGEGGADVDMTNGRRRLRCALRRCRLEVTHRRHGGVGHEVLEHPLD